MAVSIDQEWSGWRVGDIVKVAYHDFEPRIIGHVFKVETFSTMDWLEDYPTIVNPFRDETQSPIQRGPINLRFKPDWLTEANVLERLTVL